MTFLITNINDDPNQTLNVILEDSSTFVLTLRFSRNQEGWFFDLSYDDFSVTNKRLVASPNILKQYENIIPFGISCITEDGEDPFFLDDFLNERVALYHFSEEERESINTEFFTRDD